MNNYLRIHCSNIQQREHGKERIRFRYVSSAYQEYAQLFLFAAHAIEHEPMTLLPWHLSPRGLGLLGLDFVKAVQGHTTAKLGNKKGPCV
jgi:hypothetical protein